MKKFLLLMAMSATCCMGLLAQEHEYVPLVREGVKWNYYYLQVNEFYEGQNFVYTVQFDGDTVINGKSYKKCYCTFEGTRYLVAFLREEDKRVYGIRADEGSEAIAEKYGYEGFTYDLVYGEQRWDSESFPYMSRVRGDGEMQIYDFSLINPEEFEVMEIGGKPRYVNLDFMEGVGPIGENGGDFLFPMPPEYTCFCTTPMGLVSVTDLKGNIEFKTRLYDKLLGSGNQYRLDLNHDGYVDVTDVSMFIDYILGK